MNVMFINTNDRWGGAANVAWSLMDSLEENGHETSMFALNKTCDKDNVIRLPRKLHRYFHYLLSNDIEYFSSRSILETKEFKQADLVHCHNLHGWYFDLELITEIARLKPLAWTLHDMWAITPHCAYALEGKIKDGFFQCPSMDIYPRLYWHNEKYLMKRKRMIYENTEINLVVPSGWLFEAVSASALNGKPTSIIYNGINRYNFKNSDKVSARQELSLPLDKKIVAFLADGGKNNMFKGWSYVEDVISHYSKDGNIYFLCVGGAEDDRLESVRFIPKISDTALLAKYYSSADVLLFPSLAENLSLVLLEAMSCGLPVVCFDVGGNKEAVLHLQNGYVARYRQIADLVNGLDYLLNMDSRSYQHVSSNCISRVHELFNHKKMYTQYFKLYQDLLKKN